MGRAFIAILIASLIDANGIKIDPDVPKDPIIACEVYDESMIDYANSYWDLVPENLQTLLKNGDWKIYLVDREIKKNGIELLGLTYANENGNRVYVRMTQKAIREAFLHEVGHAVDIELGNISQEEEFIEQFELLDSSSYRFDGYSSAEYFADCFQEYMIDSDEFIDSNPVYSMLLNEHLELNDIVG